MVLLKWSEIVWSKRSRHFWEEFEDFMYMVCSCYSIFSFMYMVCSCYSIFSFICMFCRSLFVPLYFFFSPLCCLFLFDRWRNFRWRHIRWFNFRSHLRTRALPAPPHCTTSNAVWAVLIYNLNPSDIWIPPILPLLASNSIPTNRSSSDIWIPSIVPLYA
jgi:hypothetical protein